LSQFIKYAVTKASRRYARFPSIEEDELYSQAMEAVLVFAGLMPYEHVNAGKLAEWRTLPPASYRRYLQRALDLWLSAYAEHELEKRGRRISTVSLEWAREAEDDQGGVIGLADMATAGGLDAIEIRDSLRHCPILRMRYLEDMPVSAIA